MCSDEFFLKHALVDLQSSMAFWSVENYLNNAISSQRNVRKNSGILEKPKFFEIAITNHD